MKHKETSISIVINDLSTTEERWFAVHTKYKCEKYVVDQLSLKGIGAYVPLISKTKRYASRLKTHQVPLINSHIFVLIKKHDYVRVLQTEYVFSFIKQRRNLIHIPHDEIDILKMIVGEIEHVETGEITFEQGDEVEIIAGNLTGLKGKLIENKGKNKFVVELNNIGIQLMMTIDKNSLRRLRRMA